MFDQHVPEKYRDLRRAWSKRRCVQQWWYGQLRGRNLGLNAVAGKSSEYFNVDASRYERCDRVATTCTNACAIWTLEASWQG